MINVGIVGATGYTGAELLRLLSMHPNVHIKLITSRAQAGVKVADIYPSLRQYVDLAFEVPTAERIATLDVVFFATPHGVAQSLIKEMAQPDLVVIDLSADFRIRDQLVWEHWYAQEHQAPELLKTAVYGLPEVNRAELLNTNLIACAGCYPTSVQLGFKPLLETHLVDQSSLIANAASGVTGAGREAKVGSLFSENSDSFRAYGVQGHRHLPEIKQGLADIAGSDVELTFVPHLIPMLRGIHSTLYARLKPEHLEVDLQSVFERHFANEPFVDVLPAGVHPETRSVRGSNVCRLSVARPQGGDTVVVMAVIDNLCKGAAGQAIQCMNIRFGFNELQGLETPALMP